MLEFNKRMIRFLVVPTRSNDAAFRLDTETAYQCWKHVWGQAFSEEMNVTGPLFSDYFTKQSHMGVLFYGDEPLGLVTLNFLDLGLQQDCDDSFFKVWPEKIIDELKQTSSIIIASGNATLNFKYRKSQLGISGKDLLFAMMVLCMKSSPADVILGTPRLEKGVEKACYRTGAVPLAKNLPYTIPGQYVDLVAWKRDIDPEQWDPDIKELALHIWNNSTQMISFPLQQRKKHAA